MAAVAELYSGESNVFQPKIVLAEIGEGAQVTECKLGPKALRDYILKSSALEAEWGSVVTSNADLDGKLAIVSEFMPKLASEVEGVAATNFPVVIGGDHSCAVGTWSALAKHYRDKGDIGLIWIDAHLDSHTPDTSESGAPHGMPLASLLGYGAQSLTSIGGWIGKVKPHNVVVIGARSYEDGEVRLLKRLGVEVMTIDDVYVRGFEACLRDAIDIVSEHTVGYGITFDMDALDPLDAPGVGSPEEDGLMLHDVIDAFTEVKPELIGFELVEYNPELDDIQLTTAQAGLAILKSILK
jgi:arginase